MEDSILPLGLRYDGPFPPIGHQFTELDKSKASYGTSFIVETTDEAAVSRRREQKRLQFESAKRIS